MYSASFSSTGVTGRLAMSGRALVKAGTSGGFDKLRKKLLEREVVLGFPVLRGPACYLIEGYRILGLRIKR